MGRIVRFDCYEVDLDAGQIYKRGFRLRVSEQPFRVLAALLERPGVAVTREDLRRRLWPDDVFVDFEPALNTAVAKVREALGDSATHPRFIETLPKHGYRFIAPVSAANPAAAQQVAPRARLLVLPFVNSTGDAAQEYFSDEMTDEIITELAGLAPDMLAVIARTTAMHYKGTRKNVATIGREVGVDYVVEGAVHREGDEVALTVQLIRTSDQTHVWASRYNARFSALLSTQRAIGQTIGAHLGIASCDRATGATRLRRPTEDLTAYTLYEQARREMVKGAKDAFNDARRRLEQAVSRDPQFALAYDALAQLYWYAGFFGLAPAKEVSAAGMFYAARALEIDSTLAETHALLGLYRIEVGCDKGEIKRAFGRARELSPSSPLVRMRYGIGWLMPTGRIEEAIAELERAVESDPLSSEMRAWFGVMLWLGRQYNRAIEQAQLIIEIEPAGVLGPYLLGNFCRENAMFDEAIAAYRKAVECSGGSTMVLGWLGLALGQSGNTSEARGVLDGLHRGAEAGVYVPPTSFAWTYLGLGDVDSTFHWLDRAVEAWDHMLTPILTYPFLDPIRSDPRYAALLQKIKMRPLPAGSGIAAL